MLEQFKDNLFDKVMTEYWEAYLGMLNELRPIIGLEKDSQIPFTIRNKTEHEYRGILNASFVFDTIVFTKRAPIYGISYACSKQEKFSLDSLTDTSELILGSTPEKIDPEGITEIYYEVRKGIIRSKWSNLQFRPENTIKEAMHRIYEEI